MKKMEIFDPALCCSTGVCGASPDKELMRVASIVDKLSKNGAVIERYGLSNSPNEFLDNKTVNSLLNEKGDSILPIILLDGEVVMTGRYPSNEEFYELLLLDGSIEEEKTSTSGGCCCSSESGCC